MPDKLLRTEQVAVLLDIPTDRVASMAREGLLPAIRCGRTWRFAPFRLTEWMDSGGAGGWKRSGHTTLPRSTARTGTNSTVARDSRPLAPTRTRTQHDS
jgi:excisionase family DNA binding protein